MYMNLKHKETLQALLATQNLKSPFFNSPPQKYQPVELNLPENLQELPTDLQYIQPFSSQIWNFDEILFDMNRIWCNFYELISYPCVIGSAGDILLKYHNSGAQRSSAPAPMNSVSPPQCWCTRSHIT